MIISIIGVTINIILDYVLVFGVQGFIKPMHIEGAAIASVIAQVIMAIIALYLMLKKTPFTLKISFPFNKEIKRLLLLSFNLFLRALALNIALYFANAYATKYGNNYIAAQTIAFQIWLFFAFFMDGFSSVGNIVSGKLLGEKSYKKMYLLSKDLIKYTVLVGAILGIVCFIFYKPIGRIFTSDQEVLFLFNSIFWIVLLMQPLNAIAFIYDGIFKGLAQGATLRNVLIVATFIGFIPTLLIGDYFNLKLYAIWLAFTVWMLFRAISLMIIYRMKYLK
jgi:putative MATE family efflux protein